MIVRCAMSRLNVRAIRLFMHALGADVCCAAHVLSNGGKSVTHGVLHIAVLFAIFRDHINIGKQFCRLMKKQPTLHQLTATELELQALSSCVECSIDS